MGAREFSMTTFSARKLIFAVAMTFASTGAALCADKVEPETGLWKYQITGYGWLAGVTGDVGILGLPAAHVNISPFDALEDLSGALSGSLLASNGTWMLYGDALWAQLSNDDAADLRDGTVNVGYQQTQWLVSGLAGHVIPLNVPGLELYATAGARYQYLKGTLDVDTARFGSVSRSRSKNWIDPVIGLAFHYDFNDRWFLNGMGDIGGFGVGSDFTAQAFAAVGYNWTERFSTAIGYRALYTDYDKGGFDYNVTQHGLYTSIAYHF